MMRPATHRLNEVTRRPDAREPQPVAGAFSHVLHGQPPLMRPDKVAAVTGWSRRMIYLLCETGLGAGEMPPLETHAIPGRSVQRKQITRRSVAALLMRTANYEPGDFPKLLALTLPTMELPQLRELATAVETQIRDREQAEDAETLTETKTKKAKQI